LAPAGVRTAGLDVQLKGSELVHERSSFDLGNDSAPFRPEHRCGSPDPVPAVQQAWYNGDHEEEVGMRSSRHRPCLIAPHHSVDLTGGFRTAGLSAAIILAHLLSPPAGAQTRDPQQAALDDFVAARMLATKCPSWQIDPAEAQRRFSDLNLSPADWQTGGRHARFFDERLSYYASLLSRTSETRACAAAEEAFGPAGLVTRGWMRRQ
jgi:hypothetical protein